MHAGLGYCCAGATSGAGAVVRALVAGAVVWCWCSGLVLVQWSGAGAVVWCWWLVPWSGAGGWCRGLVLVAGAVVWCWWLVPWSGAGAVVRALVAGAVVWCWCSGQGAGGWCRGLVLVPWCWPAAPAHTSTSARTVGDPGPVPVRTGAEMPHNRQFLHNSKLIAPPQKSPPHSLSAKFADFTSTSPGIPE